MAHSRLHPTIPPPEGVGAAMCRVPNLIVWHVLRVVWTPLGYPPLEQTHAKAAYRLADTTSTMAAPWLRMSRKPWDAYPTLNAARDAARGDLADS